jgi:hypothetical protein
MKYDQNCSQCQGECLGHHEYEQAQASYPIIEAQQNTAHLCRACTGGKGDDICNYHAERLYLLRYRDQMRRRRSRERRVMTLL